jgi:L-lactate dehydrogenase (cytochrome)
MNDKAAKPQGWGAGVRTRDAVLKRRYPTIDDLRKRAKKRVPSFGFDYVEGGAGETEPGVARNKAALDAIEIVPRFGVANYAPSVEIELFGRKYGMPLGIAPMGLPGLMWPGGEDGFADAAQKSRVPFTLGSSAGAAIERMAERAPDAIWYQLYRVARDDLRINFDMAKRAAECGVHVLVLTLDVPARTKRPRELRNDLVIPYRPNLRTIRELIMRPSWLMALRAGGQPSFANYPRYAGDNPSHAEVASFVKREVGGAFSWDEVKRFRDKWPRALVVKGILHPEDAEIAVSLGVDGVQVSNHGGRQLEGAPASIDVLPAIARQVGERATVLFDGGARSGMDVIRALALGAKCVLTGRPFMYGLGALGLEGPAFVMDFYHEEIKAALRQCGVRTFAELKTLPIRHPGAWEFPKPAVARHAVAAE